MTIDFHAHPVTEEFRAGLEYLGIDPIIADGFSLPKWSEEEHLNFMKEANIDLTILSAPAPHIYNGDNKKSREVARKINIAMAKICQDYPDKFKFVATVPLPDVEGAIEETTFAIENLGAVGVKLATNNFGVYLGDKSFDPFMQELNKRHALVIIHPCRAMEYPKNPITGKVAAAMFEYPANTTRAILNMISNKVMTRFPNIHFVVPHVGSFLPYMLQRFEGISSILASLGLMDKIDATKEFGKLYFDIAGDPEPVALDMLTMVADKDKIVHGSDYPYSPAKIIIAKKEHLEQNEKYKEFAKQIYTTNAQNLLGNNTYHQSKQTI